MLSTHESTFTYSISKPYPFKWFTPAVVTGVIGATLLFSVLNFISNGYDLIVHTSSNPNQTISDDIWFAHWPSYLTSKVKASCPSVNIPVNTRLFTNHTALTYTLTGVWQEQADSSSLLPSLTYYNNVIEQCIVTSLDIDLESLDRSANQYAYSVWGASVRAYISCSIRGTSGKTIFNLTTTYDYVPSSVDFSSLNRFLGTEFLNRNISTKASLYWGESLMSVYWVYLTKTMQNLALYNVSSLGRAPIRKGTISFTPNKDFAFDVTDLRFFETNYQFVVDYGLGNSYVIDTGTYKGKYNSSIAHLAANNSYPNIWIQSDSLAKSTYSTILTDLGQVSSTTSNILTDDKLLQYFTSNFSQAIDNVHNVIAGPVTYGYNPSNATTGPLGTTPSVISTDYICQVPRLKSAGNLFVAVLIADLVFLQALWKIFTLATSFLLVRKRPDANQCEGCTNHRTRHDAWPQDSPDGQYERRAEIYQPVELKSVKSSKQIRYNRDNSSQQELLLN